MGDLNKMGTVKLSSFSLDDSDGKSFEFPADGRSIICFVKEDCPTCREVMPVIDSMAVAMASQIDFFILGAHWGFSTSVITAVLLVFYDTQPSS